MVASNAGMPISVPLLLRQSAITMALAMKVRTAPTAKETAEPARLVVMASVARAKTAPTARKTAALVLPAAMGTVDKRRTAPSAHKTVDLAPLAVMGNVTVMKHQIPAQGIAIPQVQETTKRCMESLLKTAP